MSRPPTVFRNALIVTCDSHHTVTRGDVVIDDGRIVSVGAGVGVDDARAEVIDVQGAIVMPGLVQPHVHLCQTLMRGMAEDLPLLEWLRTRVWPLEAAHDEASLRASAELGIAELLLGGTTSILDMGTVHDHDVVFDCCERMGIRAVSGKTMMDLGRGLPARLHERTDDSLRESDRLCERWHNAAGGRLRYAYQPRFILSCSETLVRQAAERAKARHVLVHTHASEHAQECDAVRSQLGRSDIEALADWGVSGPQAVLAHCVQADPSQIELLSKHQTRVVHCPSANLKLGSGIAPVAALLRAGVVVGVGADGAACNNALDAWTELRQAALLGKVREGPATFSSRQALHLATLFGARVLGLDSEVGSVEAGKRADLIVVSTGSLRHFPRLDVIDTLVYAARAHDVRHVMVDGVMLVRDGQLVSFDAGAIARAAQVQAERLMRRAGLA